MTLRLNLLFHLYDDDGTLDAERSGAAAQAYTDLLRLARQADRLPGIARVWLAEHHRPTRGRLPAPLLLSVAAARETRRVGIGPCVVILPLHHPFAVAEQVAVADLLSDGRLAVGVGSGGDAAELALFDVPEGQRRDRFSEGLEVLRLALSGEPFSYRGAHYIVPETRVTPLPVQTPEQMVWVAAGSEESAALAGRSGGHLLLARGMPSPRLRELVAAYCAARTAAGYGADEARVQVTRGVYVAEDEDTAWREAAEGVQRHYARLARHGGEEVDPREMARRGHFIIGTPEQCAAALAAVAAEVPVTDLACDIALPGMPVERVERSLDLLGRLVAPLLGR